VLTAPSPAERRQDYVNANPGLSPEVALAVVGGQVIEGMSQDDVTASLGPPERAAISAFSNSDTEWRYSILRQSVTFSTESGSSASSRAVGEVIVLFAHDRVVEVRQIQFPEERGL